MDAAAPGAPPTTPRPREELYSFLWGSDACGASGEDRETTSANLVKSKDIFRFILMYEHAPACVRTCMGACVHLFSNSV